MLNTSHNVVCSVAFNLFFSFALEIPYRDGWTSIFPIDNRLMNCCVIAKTNYTRCYGHIFAYEIASLCIN